MPNISVIIPTLNEENYIGSLLQALQKQTIKPKEIIVVDGHSSDNTQKIVKQFKHVKLLFSIKNPALQRTIGGKKASGDLLIFLDADVFPQKNFLEKVLLLHNKKHFNIACPFYVGYPGSLTINAVYGVFDFIFFLFQNIWPSGAGSCIIIEKKVFEVENGFNSAYTYDDIEFIRRAAKKRKFCIVPLLLKVSDRRFRKYGTLSMLAQYLLLSIFFIVNQFGAANKVPYVFDGYNEKNYK